MSIANYVLAAMLFWYPLQNHAYTGASEHDTLEHYISIANDIADSAQEHPLFVGDEGVLKTAMLSASTAGYESGGFRADIDDCTTVGDGGHAYTLWQLHLPTVVDVSAACADRRVAAVKALDLMGISFKMCSNLPQQERLAGYTGGSCSRGRAESRRRWQRAQDWLVAHPLR
jgi:hypothetical protein